MGDIHDEYKLMYRICHCGCGSIQDFKKLRELEKKVFDQDKGGIILSPMSSARSLT